MASACDLTLTVADKVPIKKDREFEVVAVNRECNSRSVTTQTPVSMEGNPAGIWVYICVELPCSVSLLLQLSGGSRIALRVEGGEEEKGEGAEAEVEASR